MVTPTVTRDIPSVRRQRPGPFGPARALLPKDQQLLVLEGSTPARVAIERLVDNGFSQVPLTDKSGSIIGVFSWQSFSKRVDDLHATKIEPTDLPIREAMEPARFIGPEVFIDTETDWGNIDYVLVGTQDDLLGILCIADVFGRLNDFAEAFVLIYEIEQEIRDLIHDVYNDDELSQVLDAMTASDSRPTVEVVEELKDVINEQGTIPGVRSAIKLLSAHEFRRPESLEELTFGHYRKLIFTKVNWPRFASVFDVQREVLGADYRRVNELRNIVFHFRRGITPKDTDRLRRFRDRLRYDRNLYATRQSIPAVDG